MPSWKIISKTLTKSLSSLNTLIISEKKKKKKKKKKKEEGKDNKVKKVVREKL